MAIVITNREFEVVPSGFKTNFLLAAKNDHVQLSYDINIKLGFVPTNSAPVTVLTSNQLGLTSGNWSQLGFIQGEDIEIVYTNPTNGATVTVTVEILSIQGSVLVHDGNIPHVGQTYPFQSSTITNGTMSIVPDVPSVEQIDVDLNLITNSGQNTAASLIDGELNRIRYNVDGMSVSDTRTGVQIGKRSGGNFLFEQIERVATLSGYDFSFTVRLQWANWLLFEDGLTEPISWYLGNETIRAFTRNTVYREVSNPNAFFVLSDGFTQGNVGNENENYNQGTNPFQIANLEFLDSANDPLNGIHYDIPTKVKVKVTKPAADFTDTYFAQIYRVRLDDGYKNVQTDYLANTNSVIFSDAFISSYGVDGVDVLGVSAITFTDTVNGECELEFTLTPTPEFIALFSNQPDNRYFKFALTVQTDGGTATNNDRTTLAVWEGSLLEQVPTGGIMTEIEDFFFDNHIDLGVREAWTEDDIRVHGTYRLNKVDDYSAASFRVQVVRDTDGAAFDLYSKTINAAAFPITPDGIRLFNFNELLNFELPNPNRSNIQLVYTGLEDTNTYQVAFNFPFLISWRYWNAKPQAFADFLDVTLPQNGLNDEWVRYNVSGYEIRVRLELVKNGLVDFLDYDFPINDYDSTAVTSVITIEDEQGNTLPALISGQTNIIKAVHTRSSAWDLNESWGTIAIRPKEQEPRRLISSEWAWASNNFPLSPLDGETQAEITASGNDLILKCKVNPSQYTGGVTIVSRVGDEKQFSQNVHKLETSVSRLPVQSTFEDRGYKTCGEPRLALASTDECCQFKNDVYGVSLIAESLTIELEHNGTIVPALGASINFPFQEDASGFIIDWRANLLEYGAGCVKVKVNYVINGVSGFYWDSVWDLMPYSVEASENTVQLLVNYDDLVKQDGINYTGSGFYTAIRFHGFFGNEQINSQQNNLLKSNDVRVKVRNFSAPSYDLRTRPLTRCLTRPIKKMLLNASNIWVSDFNMWNHEEYRYFNVILSEESGIEFDGDETFRRSLSCVLLDKNWTTESKFSDKEAQPPNISEIISCVSGGGGECLPATAVLRDTNNTILSTTPIASGATENITAPDGTVTVNRDGVFFADVDVTSGGVASVNVPSSTGWERPSDWLPLPTVLDTDETFVGLHAVIENSDNYVAFSFTTSTGLYQVDWGDGNVTTHASNEIAQHQYDFNTYDTGNATLSSRGYKQAIVTVTPVTGNLSSFNFNQRFVTSPVQNQVYSTGWLECKTSMPNAIAGLAVLRFSGNLTSPATIGNVRNTYLESFEIVNIGSATALRGFFFGCTSLQNVVITADTSNVTDAQQMFLGCTSLKTVPLFDTQSLTTAAGMFQACSSLRELPAFNFSSLTNMSTTFQDCTSLREIPLFNTENVTNMPFTFFGCHSLEKFPLLNTANVTNMASMIRGCFSLKYVPPLSTVGLPIMTSFLQDSFSVNKCDIIFRTSVNITNCQLSQSELVNIFNNLLDRTSLAAANINITGNWGASVLTTGERAIATGKNWTITG